MSANFRTNGALLDGNSHHIPYAIAVNSVNADANAAVPALASVADQKQRPPRSGKWLRRAVSFTLIGSTFIWLILPLVCPMTSQAVVNATLVQVRSPIDGITQVLSAELGEAVNSGSPLIALKNRQVDSIHLPELELKLVEYRARRARLVSEISETEAAEKACLHDAEKYRSGRISVLQASVRECSAEIEVATATLQARKKGLERLHGAGGAVPLVDLDSASEGEFAARKRIEMSRATLEKMQEELKSAREGIYLHQDTPMCLKRAEEMALKLPLLRSNLLETDEMLAGIEKGIEQETARLRELKASEVTSPVSGVVWTRRGNPGQVVKQNETLFDIADSKTVFVEALMGQRHMSSLAPGGRATIILTGGKTLAGRVRSVRTPGPEDADTSYAIKLGKQDLKQVRVIIDIEDGVNEVALIGRHVRVLITDEDPSALQRYLTWLFTHVGG